jgi:hypothetical protein
MILDHVGRAIAFIDIVGTCVLLILAWHDLREQTTDSGRVGGVMAIAALCFAFYLVGRAFIGV